MADSIYDNLDDYDFHSNQRHSYNETHARRHSDSDSIYNDETKFSRKYFKSRSMSQPEGYQHRQRIDVSDTRDTDQNNQDLNAQIHREILLNPLASYRSIPKGFQHSQLHWNDDPVEYTKAEVVSCCDDDEDESHFTNIGEPVQFNICNSDIYKRRVSGPAASTFRKIPDQVPSQQVFNIYATYRRAPRTFPRLDYEYDTACESNTLPRAHSKIYDDYEFNSHLSAGNQNDRNVLVRKSIIEKQSSIKHLFNIKLHDLKKNNKVSEQNRSTSEKSGTLNGLTAFKERISGILKPKLSNDSKECNTGANERAENDGDTHTTVRTTKHKEPFFYCKFITKYPKTSFLLTLGGHLAIAILTIILLLSGFDLFPTDFESLPMSDWNVPWRKRDFAWRFRNEYKHRYVRKLHMQSIDKWYRSMAYGRANIDLYYLSDGGNIFEKSKLEAIKDVEDHITSMKHYDQYCVQVSTLTCHKPTSVLRFFDGTYVNIDPVFNDPHFNNIAEVLYTASENNRTKEELAHFLSKEHYITKTHAYSDMTRSTIPIGYPLSLTQTREEMEDEMQTFLVHHFKPTIKAFKENNDVINIVYWSYLLFRNDIVDQIFSDLMLALGSVLFISVFMVYHTKSLWISALAVLSILTSFLGANMIYRIVLGFRYFGFFHVIAIFIILGIGADDLFVFLDVWKDTGFSTYPSLAHRLSDAFTKSVLSMFFTSLTTTVAFLTSAFSPLLAPMSFGVFAGILVVVNYISVILYFPTVIIIHHLYFNTWSWPCISSIRSLLSKSNVEVEDGKDNTQHWTNDTNLYDDNTAIGSNGNAYSVVGQTNPSFKTDDDEYGFIRFKKSEENVITQIIPNANEEQPQPILKPALKKPESNYSEIDPRTEITDENKEGVDGEADITVDATKQKKILVRFFRDYYFKFVTHWLIRWIIIAGLSCLVIFFAYSASRLETDNEQVQFYRKSHNYGHALDLYFHKFVASKSDRNVVVYIVWGLEERDVSGCHFSDGRCIGEERFDKSFNPHTPEAQLALKKFCDRLMNFSAVEIEEFKIRRNFTSGVPEIKCFPESLHDFLKNESKATGTDLSLPWDYQKTITFMQSKSNFYNTANFNSSFKDFLEIPISYWLNDGYRFQDTSDFDTYHTLIGEGVSDYSTPVKSDFSVFYGNRIMYLGIQVNLTLGMFSSGYPEGKPVMDKWESFVHDRMAEMPPGMQNGFQLTKDYWHTISQQKTMSDNAILGIVIGILLALPILTIATQNIVIGFFATFSMCCSTICVVGFIPLAGWKLGILESLNMCMVVGLTVDYVVHLAEGYHMSKRTDRKSRVQDMLEVMGISVFSGACTTLGASLFMFFAQIQFIIRFGMFMFCTIGFSLVFSLGMFTTLMGILGPSGRTGDLKTIYEFVVGKCRRGKSMSFKSSSIEE